MVLGHTYCFVPAVFSSLGGFVHPCIFWGNSSRTYLRDGAAFQHHAWLIHTQVGCLSFLRNFDPKELRIAGFTKRKCDVVPIRPSDTTGHIYWHPGLRIKRDVRNYNEFIRRRDIYLHSSIRSNCRGICFARQIKMDSDDNFYAWSCDDRFTLVSRMIQIYCRKL